MKYPYRFIFITNVPPWDRILIMGEAAHLWRQEEYENTLFNFTVF